MDDIIFLIKAFEDNKAFKIPQYYPIPVKQTHLFIEDDEFRELKFDLNIIGNLFQYHIQCLNISFPSNIEEYINAIEQIRDDYWNKQITNGIWEYHSSLLAYSLLKLISEEKLELKDYILSISYQGGYYSELCKALAHIVNHLNIENEKLYTFIIHLLKESYDNRDLLNEPVSIIKALAKKSDKARSLIEYIKDKEEYNGYKVLSYLLITLSETEYQYCLDNSFLLITNKKFFNDILIFYSNLKWKANSDIQLVLNKLNEIEIKGDEEISHVCIFYLSLYSIDLSKNEDLEQCFLKLNLYIENKSFPVQNSILRYLNLIKDSKKQLMLLARINHSDKNLSHQINSVLYKCSDIEIFFVYIREYSQANKYKQFDSKVFRNTISKLHHNYPLDFSNQLIHLLIADKGYHRYAALNILESIVSDLPNYDLNITADRYTFDEQHRLIAVLLTQSLHTINIIHIVLPLRNSQYQLIVEILKALLQELVWSYSSTVLKEIEPHLDLQKEKDRIFFENIQTTYKEFRENWDAKAKINEFNPKYTQASHFNRFNSKYMKKLSKSINQSRNEYNENSFMSMFPTVSLARGKTWRIAGQKEFSPLGLFEMSFGLPRDYFINPESDEIISSYHRTQDWSKKNESDK